MITIVRQYGEGVIRGNFIKSPCTFVCQSMRMAKIRDAYVRAYLKSADIMEILGVRRIDNLHISYSQFKSLEVKSE